MMLHYLMALWGNTNRILNSHPVFGDNWEMLVWRITNQFELKGDILLTPTAFFDKADWRCAIKDCKI